MSTPLISFYGDDFTGSTDAMESLARSGLRTILFTNAPTRTQLDRYPGMQAFGIAGMTRTLPPEAMEQTLRPALEALRDSGAPIVHYKVCSTFDSSPHIGSIGRVIDIAAEIFSAPCVPVLVGAPGLGRYCVFGNLFARLGAEGEPHRLDRHPSMSRHPTTPMDEADLRKHLAKQTQRSIGLFDVLALELPDAQADRALDALTRQNQIVLLDMLYERHLPTAGRLIDGLARTQAPLFVVGSSGVESALAEHWRRTGVVHGAANFASPAYAGPIVAMCGSCSPVTAGQIRWAIQHGFSEVEIDPNQIDEKAAAESASRSLRAGRSAVIHTGMGDAAKRVDAQTSRAIGPALGAILRTILEFAKPRRVLIAGGDTSGAIARALEIESMEMIAELTRGSPLCRITAPGSPADGIEMTFKGGQIGSQDFFGFVEGKSP